MTPTPWRLVHAAGDHAAQWPRHDHQEHRQRAVPIHGSAHRFCCRDSRGVL